MRKNFSINLMHVLIEKKIFDIVYDIMDAYENGNENDKKR
jgi:hypothetical protein